MRGETVASLDDSELDRLSDTMSYAEASVYLCHEPNDIDNPPAVGKGTELPFELPRGAELVRAVREGRISRHLLPEVVTEDPEPATTGFVCGDCGYTGCNCRTSRY